MALESFFSLTPLQPRVSTYDAANPDGPYAFASLYTYGGYMRASSPNRIGDQSNNDEIIVGWNPVALTEQTIGDVVDDVYRRCAIRVYLNVSNVSTKNQLLLLFGLRDITGVPSAQFFVNTDWVRTEELAGEEQVAMLMDCPASNFWTQVYVRLASPNYYASMGFKGVEGYLL